MQAATDNGKHLVGVIVYILTRRYTSGSEMRLTLKAKTLAISTSFYGEFVPWCICKGIKRHLGQKFYTDYAETQIRAIDPSKVNAGNLLGTMLTS